MTDEQSPTTTPPTTHRKGWRLLWATMLMVAVVVCLGLAGLARFMQLSANFTRDREYGVVDRATIYTAHLTMCVGGYVVGLREVAAEAFLMHFPGQESRIWFDDFPMGSGNVVRVAKDLAERFDALSSESREGRSLTERVAWRDYHGIEYRHGLALNSLHLTATMEDDGMIAFRGVVRCSYPERGRVTLFTVAGRPFVLEEGLYHYLEDIGWLYPYNAVWVWKIPLAEVLEMPVPK